MTNSIEISVIIPVRNEAKSIGSVLTELANQYMLPDAFEVIVVDGGSEDDTAPIARELGNRFRHFSLLYNPKKLSSAARNLGVCHAQGKYIVIIDGHCILDRPDYLQQVLIAFQLSGADSLGRPQPLEAKEPTRFQQMVGLTRHSWLGHNPDSAIFSNLPRFLPAKNVATVYRKEVFVKIGLFDENFDAGEDVEFNTRLDAAGMTCYFTPTIQVRYEPRKKFSEVWKQMRRYGKGRANLAIKHPRSVTLATIIPPFWTIWIIFAFLVNPFSFQVAQLLVASLFLYGLVLSIESIRLIQSSKFGVTFQIPILFAVIHHAFAVGFLEGLFTAAMNKSKLILNRPVRFLKTLKKRIRKKFLSVLSLGSK